MARCFTSTPAAKQRTKLAKARAPAPGQLGRLMSWVSQEMIAGSLSTPVPTLSVRGATTATLRRRHARQKLDQINRSPKMADALTCHNVESTTINGTMLWRNTMMHAFGFALVLASAIVTAPAFAVRLPAPEGAKVYIISPSDGATVSSPVTIRFGLQGMGIAPAGIEKEKTGHHHLLIVTFEDRLL